jgi:hypothetical protein
MPEEVPVALPVVISGIPAGLEARANEIRVKWSMDGEPWQEDPISGKATLLPDRSAPHFFWMEIKFPKYSYDSTAKNGSQVLIKLWVDLTLYRNLHSSTIGENQFAMPGVEYCQAFRLTGSPVCKSALRSPSNTIMVNGYSGYFVRFPKSPFPAELGIRPIVFSKLSINPSDSEWITGEPAFRVQRNFDLDPITLKDYVEFRAK